VSKEQQVIAAAVLGFFVGAFVAWFVWLNHAVEDVILNGKWRPLLIQNGCAHYNATNGNFELKGHQPWKN
jgi:hypothetical protein